MTIVVSSARNEALRPADLLLTRGLALAVLAALLALGIARLAGKAAIGRSLARLADAAGKLAAGDLTARAHTATGSREIRPPRRELRRHGRRLGNPASRS